VCRFTRVIVIDFVYEVIPASSSLAWANENNLVKPGGITLSGVPIDLRRITTPSFLLSSRGDHIAPWRSTYAATRIYSAPMKFVLSASGHIAGVISPPRGQVWLLAKRRASEDTG